MVQLSLPVSLIIRTCSLVCIWQLRGNCEWIHTQLLYHVGRLPANKLCVYSSLLNTPLFLQPHLYARQFFIVECYLTALSMQIQQVLALVATLLLSGALAAAPGDESSVCQWSDPETQMVLMDSNRYSNLIQTRETERVWREFDVDGGNSVKTEWCI